MLNGNILKKNICNREGYKMTPLKRFILNLPQEEPKPEPKEINIADMPDNNEKYDIDQQ